MPKALTTRVPAMRGLVLVPNDRGEDSFLLRHATAFSIVRQTPEGGVVFFATPPRKTEACSSERRLDPRCTSLALAPTTSNGLPHGRNSSGRGHGPIEPGPLAPRAQPDHAPCPRRWPGRNDGFDQPVTSSTTGDRGPSDTTECSRGLDRSDEDGRGWGPSAPPSTPPSTWRGSTWISSTRSLIRSDLHPPGQ